MKKIKIIFTALLIASLLCSCGNDGNESSGIKSEVSEFHVSGELHAVSDASENTESSQISESSDISEASEVSYESAEDSGTAESEISSVTEKAKINVKYSEDVEDIVFKQKISVECDEQSGTFTIWSESNLKNVSVNHVQYNADTDKCEKGNMICGMDTLEAMHAVVLRKYLNDVFPSFCVSAEDENGNDILLFVSDSADDGSLIVSETAL